MNLNKALKFFAVAEAMQNMSKDPSTKVGAVAIDDNYNILSVGYNGFPRGINDDIPSRFERPEKYQRTVHAEGNVVAQAARKGVVLEGSTLLITSLFPCSNCTVLMIQAGVKRVITSIPNNERWVKDAVMSTEMLAEAGIRVIHVRRSLTGVWELDAT